MQIHKSSSQRHYLWLPVVFAALLSAQRQPVTVPDGEVSCHRQGPVSTLRVHSPEKVSLWDNYVTLQAVVAPDGHVESARAVAGPAAYLAQAQLIEGTRKFKPFAKSGGPVRALIKDYVRIAPSEEWANPGVPFPEIKNWKSLRMTLQRSGCYGTCPAYSVMVSGDGTVTFHGGSHVLVSGEQRDHISEHAVKDLFAAFRRADFFSLQDEYTYPATDNPTYITSIEFDGYRKGVKDYIGINAGMPDVVAELEEQMDRTVGTWKWVSGTAPC